MKDMDKSYTTLDKITKLRIKNFTQLYSKLEGGSGCHRLKTLKDVRFALNLSKSVRFALSAMKAVKKKLLKGEKNFHRSSGERKFFIATSRMR